MVKISVIVPVYNVKDYVVDCLLSIEAQEFREYEVIIVDDGSTDGSGKICDDFAQTRQNYKVVHQSNQGLSEARNTGVKNAQGEWLVFVDSDDLLPPSAFLNMMEVSTRGADVIVGEIAVFTSTEKAASDCDAGFEALEEFSGMNGTEFLSNALKRYSKPLWSACRNYVRREFWERCCFEFERGITSEDMHLIPRVQMMAQCVIVCPKVIYNYRVSRLGSIMTQRHVDKELCFIQNISFYKKFFNQNIKYQVVEPFLMAQFGAILYNKVCRLGGFSHSHQKQIIQAILPYWRLVYSCKSARKWKLLFNIIGPKNTLRLISRRYKRTYYGKK